MEFILDFPLIRDILEQEHARARDEIRAWGVLRALESSQQRHDARIAAAPHVGTLACRADCTWCCCFTVDIRAAEVFRIQFKDLVDECVCRAVEHWAHARELSKRHFKVV